MTYKCKNCNLEKMYEEMTKDDNRPNGIKNTCKKCDNDRIKEYRAKSKLKAKEKTLMESYNELKEELISIKLVQVDMYKMLKNLDIKTKP